ncbi:MAG: D-alanyl-D-alanine carboxypeptidase [Tagaea sp.]|nr:D-alanyl-D-alanine carboxypeptidase [Tagaea sp.]
MIEPFATTVRRTGIIPALGFALAILLGFAAPAQARYASIVVDYETGRVLSEQGADERRHPASLTKIMTLYLIFEALDQGRVTLNTRWTVSEFAAGQSPTKLGLDAGDRVTVRDVILGLVTRSANDAAVVAAEGLAGSEPRFAELMTRRAREIGMPRTVFMNASGLPHDDQITTVRDMATLGREIIRRYPHHYHYFSTREFTFEGRKFNNHNRLMGWYEGADGIKTGFIRASGFNLVASAVRDGRRIVGAVIGGPNPSERDQHMGRLLDAGFGAAPGPVRTAQRPQQAPRAQTQVASASPSAAPAKRANPPQRAEQTAAVQHAQRPGDWGVQVGAFAKQDSARRAAQAAQRIAPRALSDATVDIVQSSAQGPGRFRARLVGITQTQARDACRVLDQRDMDCMTVGPLPARPATRVAESRAR